MSTPNWDRLWRSAGIQFVILFIIGHFVYGDQPNVGSSPDTIVSFYDGNRTRILIATFIFGMAVLYLLWFAAASASTASCRFLSWFTWPSRRRSPWPSGSCGWRRQTDVRMVVHRFARRFVLGAQFVEQ